MALYRWSGCVIILFIALFQNVYSNNNVFIVQKGLSIKCATNSTYGLTWVSEAEIKKPSEFIPKQDETEFSCDMSSQDSCYENWQNDKWKLIKSSDSQINEIILDRRWEELKIIHTEDEIITNSNIISNNLKPSFKIPLSIRNSKQVNIFLCDGQSINESNCYWFLLQGWKGLTNRIRKCKRGQIRLTKMMPSATGTCNKPFFAETKSSVPFITDKYWTHFEIVKEGNYLAFNEFIEEQSRPIIYLQDNYDVISVTHLIINSQGSTGYWKFHNNYEYLYSDTESEETKIGPTIRVTNNTICISMFVWMCHSCTMKFSVRSEQSLRLILEPQYVETKGGWTEIKLYAEGVTYNSAGLFVTTINTLKKNKNSYWAIDKVRVCKNQEYRVITTSTLHKKCQLVSENRTLSIQIDSSKVEGETIGRFCVPCRWIFSNNCDEATFCDYSEGKFECYCAAGFWGSRCRSNCGPHWYGHGCLQKCGHCPYDRCEPVTGICIDKKCENNYSGEKCDIEPGIVFKRPPQLVNSSYYSCTVGVNRSDIFTNNMTEVPVSFTIQAKSAEDYTQQPWQSYGLNIDFNDTRENYDQTHITIEHLHPDRKYFIRAIITSNYGHKVENEKVNFTICETKCDDIPEDEINISPANFSVKITLPNNETICKTEIYFDNQKLQHQKGQIYITNLLADTAYFVVVESSKNHINKTFRTDEGVPSRVENLTVESLSPTSTTLKWNEPLQKNGAIKKYVIKYWFEKSKACDGSAQISKQELFKDIQSDSTSIMIVDLIPFSEYEFEVYATTKYAGEIKAIKVSTQELDLIEQNEIVDIENINPKSTSITINFSQEKCSLIRGRLSFEVFLHCKEEWCKRNETEIFHIPHEWAIRLDNLYPFSHYSLSYKVCRNGSYCQHFENVRSFKTLTAVPNEISGLQVYSKNYTSISIRWKPPYPPTGILNSYEISQKYYYYYYNYHNYYNKTNHCYLNCSCKLWPEYCCYTITGLYKNYQHKVIVKAANEEPKGHSNGTEISATTSPENSEAPYDLSVTWTESNALVIFWKHPNATNGDLKQFNICLNKRPSEKCKKLVVTTGTYRLTYNITIDEKEIKPASTYKISVTAVNEVGFASVSTISTNGVSPPDIPSFHEAPEYSLSNETIRIKFSLTKTVVLPRLNLIYRPVSNSTEIPNNTVDKMHINYTFNSIDLKKFDMLYECVFEKYETSSQIIAIGILERPNICHNRSKIRALKPGTTYNIVMILNNTHHNKSRFKLYSEYVTTLGEKISDQESDSSLFALFLLMFLVPICILLFVKREFIVSKVNSWKTTIIEPSTGGQSLEPLDDHIPLASSPKNSATDGLKHKSVNPVKPQHLKTEHSKRIKVTEFEEYVKESLEKGELIRQHGLFPRGQTNSWDYGALKENKPKNRYNNLCAYDHTRVVLNKIEGDEFSDYINANYIDGYKNPKAYIATQGPKATTLNDFWRMIWEKNVHHIVMLANIEEGGKKKVEKYWPSFNEDLQFGNIRVQYLSNTVYADYESRNFNVIFNNETRKVTQLHFCSWPDHGVPLYSQSLVPFLQKLLKIPLNGKSPLVVHCSAGVGRTGTIILCDASLRMAAREGFIDMLNCLQKLRDQRPNMVDNVEQYKLGHLVVLECLVGLHTSIPCNEIEESVRKLLSNDGVQTQMRYLTDTMWQDQAMKTIGQTEGTDLIVKEKNRFQSIIPEIQERIYLTRYPCDDETTSYINAVKVDGFRSPGRFIVTQQPLPNTLGDFWRFVAENNVQVIVSLNKINKKDKTSCQFFPTSTCDQIRPVDFINLKHTKTTSLESYSHTTLQMKLSSEDGYRVIDVMEMKTWHARTLLPKSVEEFLSFCQEADNISRKSHPVIVTCYDGAKASGLYVATSFLIEKMKLEQVCDVCQTVRAIRHNRNQFVKDDAQYTFLYEVAVRYITGFQPYANFN